LSLPTEKYKGNFCHCPLCSMRSWNRNRRNRNFLRTGTGTYYCSESGLGTRFFLFLENCAKYCLDLEPEPELEPELEPGPEPDPEPGPEPGPEPEPEPERKLSKVGIRHAAATNHYGSTTLPS